MGGGEKYALGSSGGGQGLRRDGAGVDRTDREGNLYFVPQIACVFCILVYRLLLRIPTFS